MKTYMYRHKYEKLSTFESTIIEKKLNPPDFLQPVSDFNPFPRTAILQQTNLKPFKPDYVYTRKYIQIV